MQAPKPGDKIHISTDLHVTHGADDFLGGLCTIEAVQTNTRGTTSVSIVEDPGTWFTWDGYLALHQEEWKAKYGDRPGRRNPDLRPEFNTRFDEP